MPGPARKLNLGCGARKIEGFIGVDKYGTPDVRHDLEQFPWPWADSTVAAVKLIHVLEHLGRDPDVFIGIMKELYRVCAPGAKVEIVVPHPRHDNFIGDPTHVRPVTLGMMTLFDRTACEEWQRGGFANTPLARQRTYKSRNARVFGRGLSHPPQGEAHRTGGARRIQRSRNNVISESGWNWVRK
jgi:hypothetical protein